MRRFIVAGAAALVVAGLIVIFAGGRGGLLAAGPAAGEDARGGPLPVATQRVQLQDSYEITARYAGRIVSRRTSELGFERGGRLARVDVDDGAQVPAGQVLAMLDTRALEAQLAQARAAVREASARLKLATVTVERQRKLLERRNISQQRFDEARFERDAIAAQLEGARANVKALETALDLARIEAPYDGHVVARMADEGTIVSPGQPVLRLREADSLEAHVGVPPEALPALRPGDTYQIEVRGALYPAVLSELVAEVDPQTRTVNAIFLVEAPDTQVRAGELARLGVIRRVSGSGFWVPVSALTEDRRGLWSLFVPVSDGNGRADAEGRTWTLERRVVQLLHTEADRAFVRGTLRDGEVFVADGTHRLVPGQLVRADGGVALRN